MIIKTLEHWFFDVLLHQQKKKNYAKNNGKKKQSIDNAKKLFLR